MEEKELKVYKKMVADKYKFYNLWRILAIVFICLTVIFAILYFASDSVVTTETNNNDVEVVNDGGSNKTFVTINN